MDGHRRQAEQNVDGEAEPFPAAASGVEFAVPFLEPPPAALAGAAPIPASSGKTVRHRLNRSGNRQLSRALHTIALSRLLHDPDTRAYADHRRAEGKTDREIKRCLKRYIARQLYRQLENRPQPAGSAPRGSLTHHRSVDGDRVGSVWSSSAGADQPSVDSAPAAMSTLTEVPAPMAMTSPSSCMGVGLTVVKR